MWIEPEQYRLVGACLAAARRRAKLTQIQAAERLGKTQSFVSEIERGLRRVDVLEIILIARGLVPIRSSFLPRSRDQSARHNRVCRGSELLVITDQSSAARLRVARWYLGNPCPREFQAIHSRSAQGFSSRHASEVCWRSRAPQCPIKASESPRLPFRTGHPAAIGLRSSRRHRQFPY